MKKRTLLIGASAYGCLVSFLGVSEAASLNGSQVAWTVLGFASAAVLLWTLAAAPAAKSAEPNNALPTIRAVPQRPPSAQKEPFQEAFDLDPTRANATPMWAILVGTVLYLTGLWEPVAFLAFLLALLILGYTWVAETWRRWEWNRLSPEQQNARLNEMLSKRFGPGDASPREEELALPTSGTPNQFSTATATATHSEE